MGIIIESGKAAWCGFFFFLPQEFLSILNAGEKLLAEPGISLYDVKRNNYYLRINHNLGG
ncbi:hypothetical protein D2910_06745 [Planomicrobium okeanokoites]|nr:hypothetical protein D2910_06745 [Planomicrobium okeanokoites]